MTRVYSSTREDLNAVVVDWNLGNTCSVKCQYCDPWFHKGTNAFPNIEPAKAILTKIADRHRSSNRPLALSLVGGEPTEWADLSILCRHADEEGFSVTLASNGGADERTWQKLLPFLQSIRLTYHASTNWDHFLSVAERSRASFVEVAINFAMTPENFSAMQDRHCEIGRRGFQAYLQPLYRDHTRRTQPLSYSDEQFAILFPHNGGGDLVIEQNNTLVRTTVDTTIHEGANSFTGMRCGIGIDQIVIDQDGQIRGGWCRVGELLGNVNRGDFEMPTEAVICPRKRCMNPLDLAVPKWTQD